MKLTWILPLLGVIAAVSYTYMGLVAVRHIKPDANPTELDRVVGWSLWWWLDKDRYDETGRKLCAPGAIAFLGGGACWAIWFWMARP